MTLPDMINRAGPGDSMVPGLFHTPAMVEVLGEGSFDADGDDARFTAFEASGLPMAQQASASWTLSQLEGVMDDGPLNGPFSTMGHGGDKLQRAITKRCGQPAAKEGPSQCGFPVLDCHVRLPVVLSNAGDHDPARAIWPRSQHVVWSRGGVPSGPRGPPDRAGQKACRPVWHEPGLG